jgi:hypothetical protein
MFGRVQQAHVQAERDAGERQHAAKLPGAKDSNQWV